MWVVRSSCSPPKVFGRSRLWSGGLYRQGKSTDPQGKFFFSMPIRPGGKVVVFRLFLAVTHLDTEGGIFRSDELIGEEFPDAVVVSGKGMLAIVGLEGHAVGADMQIAGTVAYKEAIVVMKDPEHGTSPPLDGLAHAVLGSTQLVFPVQIGYSQQ